MRFKTRKNKTNRDDGLFKTKHITVPSFLFCVTREDSAFPSPRP
jgi:hypothetical protein